MAFSINTNIASLQSQDYLRVTNDFQGKTLNRVTSGLRIVASGDDAAGLAIANGYRSDQAVLMQGVRNANDGLSTLQTIDGGINNISKLLDRARTLATQSASGTFEDENRDVLNKEFQSVMSEIDRQATAIGLNSGGDFALTLSVFVGGGRGHSTAEKISNGTVSVDMSASTVDTVGLGLKGYTVTGAADLDQSGAVATALGGASSFTFKVVGTGFADDGVNSPVTVTVNTTNVGDLGGLVAAINEGLSVAGTGNTAYKNAKLSATVSGDGTTFKLQSTGGAFIIATDGTDAATNALMGTSAGDVSLVASGVHSKTLNWTDIGAGVSQVITVSTVDETGAIHKADITLAANSSEVLATQAINSALQNSQDTYLKSLVVSLDGDNTNRISFASSRAFNVTVGAVTGNVGLGTAGQHGTTVEADDDSANAVTLDISNATSAKAAVLALGDAVVTLGKAQAVVGKGQNQFSYAVNLAQSQLGNLAAAESRIRDADLANEAANMTKAQILLQAGIAALAQANSAPQQVLSLLRG